MTGIVFDIKEFAVYDGPRHPHDGVYEGLPFTLYLVSQSGGAKKSTGADGQPGRLHSLRRV